MKKAISFLVALSLLLLTGCSTVDPKWKEQYDLGNTYLSEGNYEDAIASFSQAVEIDESQEDAYLSRGDAYAMSAQKLAEDSEANDRTLFSYLINAEADYRSALARNKKLANTVTEKMGTTEDLKKNSLSYQNLGLTPSTNSDGNADRTVRAAFQSTLEAGYSTEMEITANNCHTILMQPASIDVNVSESLQTLSKSEYLNLISICENSDLYNLYGWLDSHIENYKKITAVMNVNSEWKQFTSDNAVDGVISTVHFGYVDLFTNLSIECTENTSYAINTLDINGQKTEILVIMSGVSAFGKPGETFGCTNSITILVPTEYDLGVFYAGTTLLGTDQSMSPQFVPFTDLPGAIETHFIAIND